MAKLVVHGELIDEHSGPELVALCPFAAIAYEGPGHLAISAGCKMCKLCVKNGPTGAITLEEDEPAPGVDKSAWRGVAVYAQQQAGALHGVTLELVGKARELAAVTGQPVYAVLPGHGVGEAAEALRRHGVDVVYTYDDMALAAFSMEPYAAVFADFVERVRPSSVLVGATNLGRALAPRVAARFRTGLTADCTVLQMKENTDLVQIRPAFGGNIMAQIICPNHRPQFCTARYKVFTAPQAVENPAGRIEALPLPDAAKRPRVQVVSSVPKPKQVDISEAERIVALGRGVRKAEDVQLASRLADALGAQLACTRPLVEAGWMDARSQIGLSGRTVGAKLIVTLGVSGAVQFAAGMRGCEQIIALNTDAEAPIFDIAHTCVVGDWYEVLPQLLQRIEKGEADAV